MLSLPVQFVHPRFSFRSIRLVQSSDEGSMPKRSDEPRFKVGDRVEVLSTIVSRFSGRTAVIIAISVNRYSRSLDKYTVQFEDASQNVFWEIQLKGVGPAA
jgi:hypothetical protein